MSADQEVLDALSAGARTMIGVSLDDIDASDARDGVNGLMGAIVENPAHALMDLEMRICILLSAQRAAGVHGSLWEAFEAVLEELHPTVKAGMAVPPRSTRWLRLRIWWNQLMSVGLRFRIWWLRRVAGRVRRLVKPVSLTVLYSLCIVGVYIAYAVAALLGAALLIGAMPILLTALAGWCTWHIAGGIQRGLLDPAIAAYRAFENAGNKLFGPRE